MPTETAALAAPLTLRRGVAVLLGTALVAAAAQIAIPLPGTPVPMTLQPLAVLLVGGLLGPGLGSSARSEEHTSELQSQSNLVCRLLLEKKKQHDTGNPIDSQHECQRHHDRGQTLSI